MDIMKELKRDGLLLKEISKKEQTAEMCKIAVKQNPLALKFVSMKYLDSKLCSTAVQKDGKAFRYVPNKFITKKMCELAVEADPKLLDKVPEDFKTLDICINAVKKNVSTLSYVPYEKAVELFDDKTEFALLEKIVAYNSTWLQYMPNRPDVRALCIKCMEKDFSVAGCMPEHIKKSEEILDYQKSNGKLQFIEKYYDSINEKFGIKVEVVYRQHQARFDESKMITFFYRITIEFEEFDKFYNFLDGNLYDAELRNYSFKGIELKKYNIDGAVINSEILQSQGLYDGTYFSAVKKHMEDNPDEIIQHNEIMIPNGFRYPKPVDDGEYGRFDVSHIPFFYISDIHLEHRIYNEFGNRATKEEIRFYIKSLTRRMVESIGIIPENSYLLIAGDTSSMFEFTSIFFNELIQMWKPNKIVVVAGNHELWDPWVDMEENIETYRDFFHNLGITFLQNDLLYVEDEGKRGIIHEAELLKMSEDAIRELVQCSSVVILGGIGFSGLNEVYNASRIKYGKSFKLFEEVTLQKDIQEASRFNTIYKKLLKELYQKRVIVLTHTNKEDWNAEEYNPYWIYLNGHTHRNFYEIDEERRIYADNQIGYKAEIIGLKWFYCDNDYDIFAYYQDGIYEITKEQYVDFNRGKMVLMSFNRKDGNIYMIKKNNTYMFMIYCMYSKKSKEMSLYLLNGGKLKKLERSRLEDLPYYYDNLEKYTENVKQLLYKYAGRQQELSKFVKSLGGSGKIHGCIVDVERPNARGFSWCHLFVNPIDGKITPYYAFDVTERWVYKDFKTLLQENKYCKLMADNYLRLEGEYGQTFPVIQYSEQMEEWGNENHVYDEGNYTYKISRVIRSLQYCMEKNIVRFWNENLLNYDFITHIKQANQIDEMIDERLMIDEKDI